VLAAVLVVVQAGSCAPLSNGVAVVFARADDDVSEEEAEAPAKHKAAKPKGRRKQESAFAAAEDYAALIDTDMAG
jgi:hypothetical protein